MDKALEFEPTAEDAARMQAAIAGMLDEMRMLRLERRRNQADLEQSQTETRAMLKMIADELAELRASY